MNSNIYFLALNGAQNGHQFVREALDKGAACAIIQENPGNTNHTDKLIKLKSYLSYNDYVQS